MPRKLTILKTLIILTILISCRSKPIELIGEQCAIILDVIEDGENLIIDEDNSACVCRDYKLSNEYIGSIGNEKEKHVLKCNKLIGRKPKEYKKLTDFRLDVQDAINEK